MDDNDLMREKIFKRVLIGIASMVILFVIINSESTTNKEVSRSDAESLCRLYIADLFGRSPSIIKTSIMKDDGGLFVKASYQRPSDNSEWVNVCHIHDGIITWAALNNGNLGRWRYEDDTKIYYDSNAGMFKLMN